MASGSRASGARRGPGAARGSLRAGDPAGGAPPAPSAASGARRGPGAARGSLRAGALAGGAPPGSRRMASGARRGRGPSSGPVARGPGPAAASGRFVPNPYEALRGCEVLRGRDMAMVELASEWGDGEVAVVAFGRSFG